VRYSYFKFKKIYLHDSYNIVEIKIKNRHVFCGYYDINPFSSCNDKLLLHISSRNLDKTEIAYYDIGNHKIFKLCNTNVNSWQMGSRLQWFMKDKIIFNDFVQEKFVSKIIDIKGNILRIIDYPLYAISKKRTIALSLDFFLLHLLREGYGYRNLNKRLYNYYSESVNSIDIIGLDNNKIQNSIRMNCLLKKFPIKKPHDYYHYFNHLSFNTNDSHFSFFHLWKSRYEEKTMNRLFIADLNCNIIFLLEEKNRISHYTWKNEHQLLITTYINGKCIYVKYTFDFIHNTYLREEINDLSNDGHPTYVDLNSFISDTYPNRLSYQNLYIYSENTKDVINIASIYSNPMFFGVKRCDLHPKLSVERNIISVDVHLRKTRSVLILDNFRKRSMYEPKSQVLVYYNYSRP